MFLLNNTNTVIKVSAEKIAISCIYNLSATCSFPCSKASLLRLFHMASVSGAISSPSRYDAALLVSKE